MHTISGSSLELFNLDCRVCCYITFNYKPCKTLTALLNIRLTISISGPNVILLSNQAQQHYFSLALLSCDFDWDFMQFFQHVKFDKDRLKTL